jgi:hypothetical protein
MSAEIVIDASGCEPTIAAYMRLVNDHLDCITTIPVIRIKIGDRDKDSVNKCAIAANNILSWIGARQYADRITIESAHGTRSANKVKTPSGMCEFDRNTLLVDVAVLRDEDPTGQFYTFARCVKWMERVGIPRMHVNLPAGANMYLYAKFIERLLKDNECSHGADEVTFSVEGEPVGKVTAVLAAGDRGGDPVLEMSAPMLPIVDAVGPPTMENYMNCVMQSYGVSQIVIGSDGNVDKCTLALVTHLMSCEKINTVNAYRIVRGDQVFVPDANIYKTYGIIRIEGDVAVIDITKLHDERDYEQFMTYTECLRMIVQSHLPAGGIRTYLPGGNIKSHALYAFLAHRRNVADMVTIIGDGQEPKTARAIVDEFENASVIRRRTTLTGTTLTKVGSTASAATDEMAKLPEFSPERGDDWVLPEIPNYATHDEFVNHHNGKLNAVYYDAKVDTPDGFKNDIRRMVDALVKRGGYDITIWVHLWDASRLREYKGFISGLLGSDLARGREAIRFYTTDA